MVVRFREMSEPQSSPKSGSASEPVADEVERYDLENWRERASVFGVSEHVIAGALSGDNRRKSWTEEQVRDAVKDFTDPKRTPGS